MRDVCNLIIGRPQKMCNFLEFGDKLLVYKKYASLYFIVCTDPNDNAMFHLGLIHHFVKCLDTSFSNVCELDLIFSFQRVRSPVSAWTDDTYHLPHTRHIIFYLRLS